MKLGGENKNERNRFVFESFFESVFLSSAAIDK